MMPSGIPMAFTKAIGIWKAMQEDAIFLSIRWNSGASARTSKLFSPRARIQFSEIEEICHSQTAF
jgi:hypothetical protein